MIEIEGAKQAAHSEAFFKKKALEKQLKEYVPSLIPREEWENMPRKWDDTTRVRFMRDLPKDITYNQLKDALYARGFMKPSSMERDRRIKLLKLIQKEGLEIIERMIPDAAK